MRTGLILAPLLLCAAPVFAQPAPKIQPIAVDPAVTNRLVDVAQSLAQAMLSTPVGDIEAAVQGRKPTAADRGKTVASEAGVNERDLRASIDAARPVILRSIDALAKALPAMTKGLAQAQQAVDRAAANMPDPNYPNR